MKSLQKLDSFEYQRQFCSDSKPSSLKNFYLNLPRMGFVITNSAFTSDVCIERRETLCFQWEGCQMGTLGGVGFRNTSENQLL